MASVVSRTVIIGSRVPKATTWLAACRLRSSEAGPETLTADVVGLSHKKEKYVVNSPSHEEALFHDFKYHLVASPSPKLVESRFASAVTHEDQRPLVLLFGWAGATEKNLAKYASIYHRAGCSTLAYILPTRFIFRSTADVPFLTKRLLKIVEMEGLLHRPFIFHNMSDTGLMCYQGVHKIAAERGLALDIRGSVLDSCPGPRPKITLPRVMALTLVNWFCSMRDGISPIEAVYDSYRLLVDRAWPNYWRQRKGQLLELSEIDGVWSGDFLRHERPAQPWPELFLYSRADFYLPHTYLEDQVLKPRQQQTKPARDVRTVCWSNSSHVAHLRKHKKEYTNAVLDFIMDAYFKKIRK